MDAPEELVEAVARAINGADNEWADAPRTMPHEVWPVHVARAVLAVPVIADALAAMDAVRYRLRAEARWLEAQPASEWATTRQVAVLDVIRLLDGGPWVDRKHVTGDERCWCDPKVETIPAKKPATEAADPSIQGDDQ